MLSVWPRRFGPRSNLEDRDNPAAARTVGNIMESSSSLPADRTPACRLCPNDLRPFLGNPLLLHSRPTMWENAAETLPRSGGVTWDIVLGPGDIVPRPSDDVPAVGLDLDVLATDVGRRRPVGGNSLPLSYGVGRTTPYTTSAASLRRPRASTVRSVRVLHDEHGKPHHILAVGHLELDPSVHGRRPDHHCGVRGERLENASPSFTTPTTTATATRPTVTTTVSQPDQNPHTHRQTFERFRDSISSPREPSDSDSDRTGGVIPPRTPRYTVTTLIVVVLLPAFTGTKNAARPAAGTGCSAL